MKEKKISIMTWPLCVSLTLKVTCKCLFQPSNSILSQSEPYFTKETAEEIPISVILVTPFEKLSSV